MELKVILYLCLRACVCTCACLFSHIQCCKINRSELVQFFKTGKISSKIYTMILMFKNNSCYVAKAKRFVFMKFTDHCLNNSVVSSYENLNLCEILYKIFSSSKIKFMKICLLIRRTFTLRVEIFGN